MAHLSGQVVIRCLHLVQLALALLYPVFEQLDLALKGHTTPRGEHLLKVHCICSAEQDLRGGTYRQMTQDIQIDDTGRRTGQRMSVVLMSSQARRTHRTCSTSLCTLSVSGTHLQPSPEYRLVHAVPSPQFEA